MLNFSSVKKFLMFCVLGILCSGCQSINTKEVYSPEKLSQLNKGVAFFAITENGSSLFFRMKKLESEKSLASKQVRSDSTYFVESNEGFIFDGAPLYTTKNMLVLDPGIYYIDYIRLKTDSSFLSSTRTSRWLDSPGISNGIIRYGAFEVLASQIHFIGNLVYSEKSNSFNLNVDRQMIDKQLNDTKYKSLLDNIKIGKFYRSGSVVYKDETGNYQILSKEKVDDVTKEIIKKNKSN